MGNTRSFHTLVPAEARRFCQTGELPARLFADLLRLSPKAATRVKLELFEAYCQCGSSPPWLTTLKHFAAQRSRLPWFSYLYIRYGPAEYDAAMKAYKEYQKLKSFHYKWAMLRSAVNASSVGLDEVGGAVVLLTDKAWGSWTEYLNRVAGGMLGHIRGSIQEKARGAVLSSMKATERTVLRATVLFEVVGQIGTLAMIKKGVDDKKLAAMPMDSPESRDYRLKYFIGVAHKGQHYLETYNKYHSYDKLYWELSEYVAIEQALRGGRDVDPLAEKYNRRKWEAPAGTPNFVSYPAFADEGLRER